MTNYVTWSGQLYWVLAIKDKHKNLTCYKTTQILVTIYEKE